MSDQDHTPKPPAGASPVDKIAYPYFMSRDETSGLRAALLRLGRLPGYVRQPDLARRTGEQGHTYKKGWEVRFTARTEEEIAEIRDLVVAAGFAPARPFFKGHQLIQPVYGMAVVQAYLAARQSAEENAARTGRGRSGDVRGDVHSDARGDFCTDVRADVRADVTGSSAHGQDRRAAAGGAATAAASAAAAAAASAAASAAAVRARRQAVEAFPTQVERTTAADRIDPAVRTASPAHSAVRPDRRAASSS